MASVLSIETFTLSLPDHCSPTTPFLRQISTYFHTCIPTPLALLSTALGTLSIVSWLFAQLPQIYRNYRLGSTSGLSIFFLVEWCLGDISNLLGATFTQQATWQIIIAGYYVFVDMALVGQWFWYEKLQHGNRWRLVSWKRGKNSHDDGSEGAMPGTAIEAVEPLSGIISTESETPRNGKDNDQPQPAEHLLLISSEKAWRMPCYGSFASNKAEDFGDLASSPSSSPKSRPIFRAQPSNALPFIPPSNIVLFTSLLLTLVQVHATPTPPSRIHNPSSKLHLSASSSSASRIETAGTLLAWLSTALYLGSRLPQLLKNQRRRSTAGLAPALFAAAFFGNLFYSASLLANPCAWRDMPAWGGHGWVGRDGNTRGEWVERALPFFLGAAGVLAMDAGVGVQFLVFGEGRGKGEEMERDVVGDAVRGEMAASLAFREHEEERVVQRTVPIRIQRPDGGGSGNAVGAAVGDVLALPNSWQRVTGWMRGWMPSPQRVMVKRDESSGNNRNEAERQGLLRREEWLGDE